MGLASLLAMTIWLRDMKLKRKDMKEKIRGEKINRMVLGRGVSGGEGEGQPPSSGFGVGAALQEPECPTGMPYLEVPKRPKNGLKGHYIALTR